MELIGMAADHGGYALKEELKVFLNNAGYAIKDYGATALDPDDDYPDMVSLLAEGVSKGEVGRGIAICGSGVGAAIVANKFFGVRAALVTESYSAHQGVEHDNMNMLCMGGRVVGQVIAQELALAFVKAEYIGGGRFQRRLDKLIALEKENFKS